MLIYYNGYTTITDGLLSHADKCFPIDGNVIKVYNISGVLIICTNKWIYAFCRKCHQIARMKTLGSFIINMGHRSPIIIDEDFYPYMLGGAASIFVIQSYSNSVKISGEYIISISKVKEDWPTVSLRIPLKGPFRGFEDLVVIVEN